MVTLSEKQKGIIGRLNHKLYTAEFLQEWLNNNDDVFVNAPGALQAMGAKGFFAAVLQIEKMELADESPAP